ncbi:MAG: PPC domain-containing DNA-binding protein [Sphaerochaetaceae bacterium]
MKVVRVPFGNAVLVRLNPGDDVLEGLRAAVRENNIMNAVILAGVGSVISHHFHVIASTVNPPKEYFTKGDAAADILNLNGMIINGRVHAHITFSNEKVAYGGHLEKGCEVLTFSAITLAEVDADFDQWDSIGYIEELVQ